MSYRLALLGGRIASVVISLAIGVFLAIVGWLLESAGNPPYVAALGSAWKIFAGWFPIVIIILSLIASNSNKKFVKIAAQKGLVEWLIDDVAICAIFILATTVLLFIYASLGASSTFGTFVCTTMVVATVCLFAYISWSIFTFAKCIAEVEADKAPEKE